MHRKRNGPMGPSCIILISKRFFLPWWLLHKPQEPIRKSLLQNYSAQPESTCRHSEAYDRPVLDRGTTYIALSGECTMLPAMGEMPWAKIASIKPQTRTWLGSVQMSTCDVQLSHRVSSLVIWAISYLEDK